MSHKEDNRRRVLFSRFPSNPIHDSSLTRRSQPTSSPRYAAVAACCRIHGSGRTHPIPWPTSRSPRSRPSSCKARLSWPINAIWKQPRAVPTATRCSEWTKFPATFGSAPCSIRSNHRISTRFSPMSSPNCANPAAWTAPSTIARGRPIARTARIANAGRTKSSISIQCWPQPLWRPGITARCRWSRNSSCRKTVTRNRIAKAAPFGAG